MIRASGGIATLIALGLIIITPSLVRANYRQVACEVNYKSDYAIIWMDSSEAEKHSSLRFNVQFDPAGVVLRLPPQFYAPDWTQVENVTMRYYSNRSASGILQLRLHDTDGLAHVETIGQVKSSCWSAVKKYIHKRVEARGHVVRLSEVTKHQH